MRSRTPCDRQTNAWDARRASALRAGLSRACAAPLLVALLAGLGASLGGCTAGTPFEDAGGLPAALVDATPTGSIQPADASPAAANPLERVLGPVEAAAALTALGAALDPQSAGEPVIWMGADGKRRGVARPTAMARPEGDGICRPFAIEGEGAAGKLAAVGVACRDKRGGWRVREMSERPAS